MFDTYGHHAANPTKATYRPENSLLDIMATNRPDLVRPLVLRDVTTVDRTILHEYY